MNFVLYKVRSTLLRTLVPEFVWPKHVVIDGAKIRVRNAPYSFGVKLALKRGQEYEDQERRLLSDMLEPGDVVIEMGGSIGVLTAIIAEKVGKSGFVISVEASVKLTDYSKTWLESGNNVRVVVGFGFPVWELKEPVEIQKFEEDWGSMSGRVTFQTGSLAKRDTSNEGKQPLFDLRALARFSERPPTALVADIEGSESVIADQRPEFPRSLRNVLIELHPEIYGEETQKKIIRRIEEDGFRQLAREGNVFRFARPSPA